MKDESWRIVLWYKTEYKRGRISSYPFWNNAVFNHSAFISHHYLLHEEYYHSTLSSCYDEQHHSIWPCVVHKAESLLVVQRLENLYGLERQEDSLFHHLGWPRHLKIYTEIDGRPSTHRTRHSSTRYQPSEWQTTQSSQALLRSLKSWKSCNLLLPYIYMYVYMKYYDLMQIISRHQLQTGITSAAWRCQSHKMWTRNCNWEDRQVRRSHDIKSVKSWAVGRLQVIENGI